MRKIIALTGVLLLAAGCGKSDSGPEKRQPGSWSQKIEIVEFSAPGVTPAQKTQMQQMMNAMAGTSMCITPEFSAREDREKALTSMGGPALDCKVDNKTLGSGRIAFTATCKRGTETVRTVADGTLSATAQNVKISVETVTAAKDGGKLVMNVALKREGECKPGEFTPPAPAAATAPAKS